MTLVILCSGLIAGGASPSNGHWDIFPSSVPGLCAFHGKREVRVCWPCYGYHPTCWTAWPTGCEMCPPPASIASTPRPADSGLQVIPVPPPAKKIESPKDERSPKAREPAPEPPLPNKTSSHQQHRTETAPLVKIEILEDDHLSAP